LKTNFVIAVTGLIDEQNLKGTAKVVIRNFKKSTIAMVIVVSIFLYLFSLSANLVFAGEGSIATSNTYPEDGATYGVVDHFSYQITAVNSNTTVSIRIDDGPLIPMQYRGIVNEAGKGDNVTRGWHTWQVTIPAITTPGKHAFQFFSHYYVWQDTDHFWAEFNSYSNVQSFTIAGSSSTPSKSPPPTTTNPINVIAALATLPLAAILLLVLFLLRKAHAKPPPTT
jgi:hypothetical protein